MVRGRWIGLALWAAAGGAAWAQGGGADLVLIHGHILTVDAKDTAVQAVAVRRGVIVRTGTDAEVLKMAGAGARVIDLKGRTATPGLIDTHAHISGGGLDELYGVKLSDAASVQEIVARVKAKAAGMKAGEWITGAGWDEGKLEEKRYVTAADLDAAAPENPVWLVQTTGHYGVANTRALEMAHIGKDTPDPEAGRIERDASGNATGLLKEASAMAMVTRLIPEPTREQREAAVRYIQKVLVSEGMTAVKDPGIGPEQWEAYKAVLAAGDLKERVCVLWLAGRTMETARKALSEIEAAPRLPATLGDGRLMSCGAKIFMDGSGGSRTGWMHEDWMRDGKRADVGRDGKPNRGFPQVDPAVYREMVRLFHGHGIPVGTHAVGDRAADVVVDTYLEVERADPRIGLRHSLIHGNLPSEYAIRTMAELQKKYDAGYPEMQPGFLWWIGDIYAGNYGPQRDARLEPLRTLLEQGVSWSGGSDYPVTPLAARYGLWAAMARETAKGTYGAKPFGTKEAVDIHTALRSYTARGARQMFSEGRIGTIEAGKRADIAVWDRDVYAAPAAQVKEMKCLMTLINGEVVYRAAGSDVTEGKR